MAERGPLERMARRDLDTLLAEIGDGYEPGAVDARAEADPEWRDALDRAEREVGALFLTLCEADGALVDWRRAVSKLSRLWRQVRDQAPGVEAPASRPLADVA